jgi:hypothetical protein
VCACEEVRERERDTAREGGRVGGEEKEIEGKVKERQK